ncbi:MAG: histidinol-phosphatase HisJ family protein [Coriobacteriia bacterium]|nr:histidinol-phosphatase HisJ family protein [Coriobacteriia bacterium]
MSRELTDCHIHTRRCGHAAGTAEECVRVAIERGLSGIVFTEHLALPEDLDPSRTLSMRSEEMSDYLAEIAAVRDLHPEIAIVTGLEADYLPGRAAQTAATLKELRLRGVSVVLGSVHFLEDGWAFDDPSRIAEWDTRNIDSVWRAYFDRWCGAARSGLFDVMAHPDLVKKFGHRPSFDPCDLYREAAAAASEGCVRVEVSSAGLRKPVGEIYPAFDLLRAFHHAGVSATAGSDAHAPSEVGEGISEVYDAMARAGYASVAFPDGSGGWRELAL